MKQDDINRLEKIESRLDFFDEAFDMIKAEIINRIKDDTERENQSPLFYPKEY